MKSVRLDPGLEAKLRQAAETAGMSQSEFIRTAVAERAEALLADRLDQRLAGLIGAVTTEGGRAVDAHRRYRQLLRRKARRASTSRP